MVSKFEKDVLKILNSFNNSITRHKAEYIIESIYDISQKDNLESILKWYEICKKDSQKSVVEEIPLNSCRSWNVTEESIKHDSNDFFEVVGVRVDETPGREVVSGWDQPMVKQVGFDGGILGLIRCYIDGLPYYLCDAKFEPGNPDVVQISPTLQATFANLKRAHKGKSPLFSELFFPEIHPDVEVLFNQWFSEDGGRLYLKRNKGLVINAPYQLVAPFLTERQRFLTLFQIKELLKIGSLVSPHLRSLISWM